MVLIKILYYQKINRNGIAIHNTINTSTTRNTKSLKNVYRNEFKMVNNNNSSQLYDNDEYLSRHIIEKILPIEVLYGIYSIPHPTTGRIKDASEDSDIVIWTYTSMVHQTHKS